MILRFEHNGKINEEDLLDWISNIAEKVDQLEGKIDSLENKEPKDTTYHFSYVKTNMPPKDNADDGALTYPKAVSAIWSNFISAYYANLALTYLKHFTDAPDYYGAVIAICESKNDSDYYKYEAIKDLGRKF